MTTEFNLSEKREEMKKLLLRDEEKIPEVTSLLKTVLSSIERDDKEFIKRQIERIDNKIDHYEPYRLITDSSEMKEFRKVLIEIREGLIKDSGDKLK